MTTFWAIFFCPFVLHGFASASVMMTVASRAYTDEHIIICSEHCVLEEAPGEAEGGGVDVVSNMETDVAAQSESLTVKISVSGIVVVVVSMPAEHAPLYLDVNTSRGSMSLPTGSVQPHRPGFPPFRVGEGFI